ncbi:hypothetical protein SARC_18032, partial [Sphaeroforma arctica JP610]
MDAGATTDGAEATDGSRDIEDVPSDGSSDSDAAVPSDGVVSAPASEAIHVSLGSEAANVLGATESLIIFASYDVGSGATDAAEPTDDSRDIVDESSVTSSAEITDDSSEGLLVPQSAQSLCPPEHPFAYLNGVFCCATGLDNASRPVPIYAGSTSCQDNEFTPCPNGTNCDNAFADIAESDAASDTND